MATALLLGSAVAACDSLLDVDNPNNVLDDDIRTDVAAAAVANGALYTVQDGWDAMLLPYSMLSDELQGEALWADLNAGRVDPFDLLTDEAFGRLAQGRWMADEAIHILDSLNTAGALTNPSHLARAYLFAAIAYVTIADWMDDFVISDRESPAPAIGPDNMGSLYDTAIVNLTLGLNIAGGGELRRNLLAMRARARHARGVWDMIGRVPVSLSNNGLVTVALAAQDAIDALALDGTDWRYQFEFSPTTQSTDFNRGGGGRGNRGFGADYVSESSDPDQPDTVALLDPLDGIADPRLERFILQEFQDLFFFNLTVLSARGMRLIVAEDALARGDVVSFASEINAVRALDGLSAWTAASPISARDMLIHERRTNLFLQGRRLNDMYRFGIQSPDWVPGAAAFEVPGTFLPITSTELQVNCHLNPETECAR